MFVAILVVFTVFAGQLFRIQAFDASATQAAALSKRSVKTLTPALRGEILDTNGQVLAASVERFTVIADPVAIREYKVRVDGVREKVGVTRAASDLAPLLGMSVSQLTAFFTRPQTRYVIVKKEVNPTVWRQISALGIPGISSERTVRRVYPSGMAAGQIVGVVNKTEQKPLAGIEFMYDKTLAGTAGLLARRAGS